MRSRLMNNVNRSELRANELYIQDVNPELFNTVIIVLQWVKKFMLENDFLESPFLKFYK